MKKCLDLVIFTMWLATIVLVTCATYNYCTNKAQEIDNETYNYVCTIQDEIHENGFENIGNLKDFELVTSQYGYDLTYKVNGYTVESHYNGMYSLERCDIFSASKNVMYFMLNIVLVLGYSIVSLCIINEADKFLYVRGFIKE